MPPETFRDWRYLAAAGAAGVVCFFARATVERLHRAVLVFDAIGLSLFCVTGASKALTFSLGPAQAIILGAITGIGGGIFPRRAAPRSADSAAQRTLPIPALGGAAVVAIAHYAGSDSGFYTLAGAILCLAIRLIGLRYRVSIPIAPSERRSDQPGD